MSAGQRNEEGVRRIMLLAPSSSICLEHIKLIHPSRISTTSAKRETGARYLTQEARPSTYLVRVYTTSSAITHVLQEFHTVLVLAAVVHSKKTESFLYPLAIVNSINILPLYQIVRKTALYKQITVLVLVENKGHPTTGYDNNLISRQ
jgi:hypothetical protein